VEHRIAKKHKDKFCKFLNALIIDLEGLRAAQ